VGFAGELGPAGRVDSTLREKMFKGGF